MLYRLVQRGVLGVDNRHVPRESLKDVVRAMKEEEEDGRDLGGGGRTTTTTTTMAMATATDMSSGGGSHAVGVRRLRSGLTRGGGGDGTTTNAIRISRRKISAPLLF